MCKGEGNVYVHGMMLAATHPPRRLQFTSVKSVYIRSGAASLFCSPPDKAAPFSKALFLPIRVFILQGSFLMKFSA